MSDERLAEVSQLLYEALTNVMGELGEPGDWDADVEILFSRPVLEQAMRALSMARDVGYRMRGHPTA